MVPGRLTRADARAPSAPSTVERLESRTLLSVSLEHGVLTITGTDGNDQILVGVASRRSDQVHGRGRWRVLERGRASFCKVQVNGEVRRFKALKIHGVVVHAGAGDDTVVLGWHPRPHVPQPELRGIPRLLPLEADAVVHGGDGADSIVGGYGDDRLEGEGGDDRLYGLRGFDMVDGGDGNDVLGDACEDNSVSVMLGGPGDDIIVGGSGSRFGPGFSRPVPRTPRSMFGGPGNDQFHAFPEEVLDLEPGESVTPAVCERAV
jgi:Ca2+-binding RTX toxin-like protein